MATYTITATITKIDSENNVTINGVGKHRYEKMKDEVYNLLEGKNTPLSSKLLKQDKPYTIKSSKGIIITLLAMALLNKKPLKLTIEETETENKNKKKEYKYSITEIEVP